MIVDWIQSKADPAAAVMEAAATVGTPVEEVALAVGMDNGGEEMDSKDNLCLTTTAPTWAEATSFQMPEQQQQQQYYASEDQIQGLRVQQQQQQQPLQPDSDEHFLRMLLDDSPPVSPDMGMDNSYSNSSADYFNGNSNSMCSPPPSAFQQQQQQQHFDFSNRRGHRGSLSSTSTATESLGYESEMEIPSPQSAFDVDTEEEEEDSSSNNSIVSNRRQTRRQPRTTNRYLLRINTHQQSNVHDSSRYVYRKTLLLFFSS